MEVEEVFETFGNMLYRVGVVMLKSRHDAEDAVQDTLIKYMEHQKEFQDREHIKAWLLRVNINICKNKLRFYQKHPSIPLEQLGMIYEKEEDCRLMEALMGLPPKYKEVFLLYYVEGYKIREAARILKVSEAAVKKRLERGREKLNELLGGHENG
ncbi:MAG: RNA polymerase sigma factor [Lachnospiraceae bacterium]|nr:RNA polymerase sigma factor [Lachnospiraceae bacterium]